MSFFIQLKLEIALAIPASTEWKMLTNNSAAERVIIDQIIIDVKAHKVTATKQLLQINVFYMCL